MKTEVASDDLLTQRKPGFSLPQSFYTNEAVFQQDLERVFRRCWLFAGHACRIRQPGDYFTFEVGPDSLIISRADDGQVYGMFNTCRHRGSRICTASSGHVGKFVCPYHQWSYERDGRLAGARWMGDGFDKSQYPLQRAKVENVAGLIFVCLADEPPDFQSARQAMEPHLRPHRLERAQVCRTVEFTVRANWKTLFENHRECYHCPVGHPEFCKTNYHTNMPDDGRADTEYDEFQRRKYARWQSLGLPVGETNFPDGQWFRAARVPLRDGFVTESLDGRPLAPLMGDLPERDTGSVRIITFPNAWSHADSDYAMSTQLFPLGPALTKVTITWLVHEDARAGVDYDPEQVMALWKITTEQDIVLCENNQLGIQSSRYQPGPFSPLTEQGVETFTRWYIRQMSDE
jgi:glycine betaine catabolism A